MWMNKDMSLVDVTKELANKVEVMRAADTRGGFQRKLDSKRLPEMTRVLGGGAHCPPIAVAVVGGKWILIDGQHRLEAWKMKAFPLKATVTHMSTVDDAAKAFINLNREQKKVPLQHILSVSNDDYPVRVRRMTEDCKVTLAHIHNLMCGITGRKDPLKADVTEAHWALAAKVMSVWMKNRRWGNPTSVYSNVGVLRMAGHFAGKTKTPDTVLRDMQSMDYSTGGPLGRVEGSSWSAQAKMQAVFFKYLAEKVI